MWKHLSRIAGLLAFVLATVAGPVMAQARTSIGAEPMPCHERAMSEGSAPHKKPVEKAHSECASACQCPVSHYATGPLILPQWVMPMAYETRRRVGLRCDQRLNFALSDELMRPPRA